MEKGIILKSRNKKEKEEDKKGRDCVKLKVIPNSIRIQPPN